MDIMSYRDMIEFYRQIYNLVYYFLTDPEMVELNMFFFAGMVVFSCYCVIRHQIYIYEHEAAIKSYYTKNLLTPEQITKIFNSQDVYNRDFYLQFQMSHKRFEHFLSTRNIGKDVLDNTRETDIFDIINIVNNIDITDERLRFMITPIVLAIIFTVYINCKNYS